MGASVATEHPRAISPLVARVIPRPAPHLLHADNEVRCRCGALMVRAVLQPGSELETYCTKCDTRILFRVPCDTMTGN